MDNVWLTSALWIGLALLSSLLSIRLAIAKARETAAAVGVELISHVIIGHEVKTIVEFIRAGGFDLLVIGFLGHSALYERVMGGTCQNLVRLAPCSVVVVK
jgi:nucleotide-binding universal stress UspA family protein